VGAGAGRRGVGGGGGRERAVGGGGGTGVGQGEERAEIGRPETPMSGSSGGGVPPPFDAAELGVYARESREVSLFPFWVVRSSPRQRNGVFIIFVLFLHQVQVS
jgi:hypothetical protein